MDPFAVAINESIAVGHVPRIISVTCYLFFESIWRANMYYHWKQVLFSRSSRRRFVH